MLRRSRNAAGNMWKSLTEGWKTFLLGVVITIIVFLLTPLYPWLIDKVFGDHPHTRSLTQFISTVKDNSETSELEMIIKNFGETIDYNIIIKTGLATERIMSINLINETRIKVISGDRLPMGFHLQGEELLLKVDELFPGEVQYVAIKVRGATPPTEIYTWSEKSGQHPSALFALTIRHGHQEIQQGTLNE
jgi:hypothetical protein